MPGMRGALMVLLAAGTACAGGGGSESETAAEAPATEDRQAATVNGAKAAGGASADRVAELCDQTSNLGAELCRCVGRQSETMITANARELLVAMLEKRQDRIDEVRARLTIQDATQAATFMPRASTECARARAGQN